MNSTETQSTKDYFKNIIKKTEFSVFLALVLLIVAVSILSEYFLTTNNIFNVLRQFSVIAIVAVGQAMIIITGGIDLSVGSLLGLMGVISGVVANKGVHPLLVFTILIACGACIGLINGLIITKGRINPFIVTLGMMSIYKGISLLITGGMPISIPENKITFLGSGYIGVIPISVIIMMIVTISGIVFTTQTLTGRYIYAIGNNEKSSKLSGINVDKIKIIVFMITGSLCALGGMITSGTLKSADPAAGGGSEMDIIAAVVIGGASLSGGKGSVVGVIIGAAIMGVLKNSFVLLNISAYWQVVTIGAITIGAVAIDSFKTKRD